VPFVKADIEKEKAELNELIDSNPEARKTHEEFSSGIDLQRQLVQARKKENLTQAQLAERCGLSRQVVNRLEKRLEGNLSSFLKYLSGLGYKVEIKEKK